jgi:hypothetical protein
MRIGRITTIATIIIIMLSMIVLVIPAAGIVEAEHTGTRPVNDTPLYTVAVHGTSVPLSSFGEQEEITLFRFELNQSTFPGPRSMAFGPRYIQLTASPATLIVFGSIGFAGGAALYILYNRKKAGETQSVSTEEESKRRT